MPPIDDITGFGKLADSKLVNDVYEDALQPVTRQGGKALEDLSKALRLFTAPLQLMAVAQDRLEAFCERARQAVPPERQIEAQPEIAGPILLALRYMEDNNPVTEMFVELLTKSIDLDQVGGVHPAFPKIIEQMSPDEAVIMYSLREMDNLCIAREIRQENSFPFHRLAYPVNFDFYARHLESLDLLQRVTESFICLGGIGREFVEVCVPDSFPDLAPFCVEEE